MEIKTREVDRGTEITVETGQKVAVIVDTGSGERIYLPSNGEKGSTYYIENTSQLVETEEGYSVLHQGEIEEIRVVG